MSFLLNILLPRTCLLCHIPCSHSLCETCSHTMILLDDTDRGRTCFREKSGLCHRCHKNPSPFDRLAAALPIATTRPILSAFKQANPNLARPLASFLVAQLLALDWPTPDLICYVPQDLPHRLMNGHNCAHLLAKETARLLRRPLITAIHRSSGDFPQTGQSYEQRCALTRESFSLRRAHRLHDKIVLLVDDFIETGTTLRRCGEVLRDAFPRRLLALSVAMPQVDRDDATLYPTE